MAASPFNPLTTGLTCFACGRAHALAEVQTVCRACGMPLRVDYDLSAVRMSPATVAGRPPTLWRYREVLPIAAGEEVTLVEGYTPLIEIGEGLFIKDEARNPTGSFKARGMSVAVSAARALGVTALSAPSAGNAGGALAAYGAAAGFPVLVAMPDDTPQPFIEECRHYDAEVRLVPGTIADAARWLREHGPKDAFDVSTLREPYRVEGKKTMGYELFEQCGGSLPNVVVYPTGGGTGLVGMWKAWNEMQALGWIGASRPRLVSVQAEGCAPIVVAFEAGAKETAAFPDARTKAYGLRVPSPIGGFLCLRALYDTKGTAIAVPEADIAPAARDLASRSGLDISPEGGAAWAAMRSLVASGWIALGERVVVFNTGTGLKYR